MGCGSGLSTINSDGGGDHSPLYRGGAPKGRGTKMKKMTSKITKTLEMKMHAPQKDVLLRFLNNKTLLNRCTLIQTVGGNFTPFRTFRPFRTIQTIQNYFFGFNRREIESSMRS